MRSTIAKSLWVLLSLFVYLQLPAQQQPAADSLLRRYAAGPADSALFSRQAPFYLVKFNTYPGPAVLQQYGMIKPLTRWHYILRRPVTDTVWLRRVAYMQAANHNWKSSTALLLQLERLQDRDSLTLQASTDSSHAHIAYCRIQRRMAQVIIAVVRKADWPRFIAQPGVRFADALRRARPEIVINGSDMTLNRINTAQQQYPELQGSGMTVSLKEDLFDTTDIDLQGRYVPSGLAAPRTSSHATIMATLIAGAGNTAPAGRGVAVRARLSSASFDNSLLPDDAAVYRQLGIRLQNHSYGTGIENYYGAEAVAYDQLTFTADTVLHVFSSGNNGDQTPQEGLYSGISGLANLSGTFKQAKNVLVAGGTDGGNNLPALSAKGPAYDGRVKPALVAYGQDGTSGAAALVSGVATLVQEAYLRRHGSSPSTALVRAVLINSADDAGAPQVDYSTGYGALNALQAINTIVRQQYLSGTATPGGSQQFTLAVPDGTQLLKITLGWNDPPAVENAAKALVNDLDLWVTDAAGRRYDPWVLSSYPHADSLRAPARRGKDTLNNTEQVTIEAPVAGDIRITVSGSNLRGGAQPFFLAYQFVPRQYFQWDHPAPGDMLAAGATAPLRWSTQHRDTGTLSYSVDNGVTWHTIATDQSLQNNAYSWPVPDTFATALLRMSTADTAYTSAPFPISRPPDIHTGFNCADSALLYWPAQAGADGYEVYALNGDQLETYTRTRDTFVIVPKQTVSAAWFAVSALHPEGWAGIKSYAMNYGNQGLQCYIRSLLADVPDQEQVRLTLSLGSLYNLRNIWWERQTPGGYVPLQSTPVTNSSEYTYIDNSGNLQGIIHYRARLETTDGRSLYSDPVQVALTGRQLFLLFPNPAGRQVQLLTREPRARQVRITDMSGRLREAFIVSGMQESLPLDRLSAGVYILAIYEDGRRVFVQKLIRLNRD